MRIEVIDKKISRAIALLSRQQKYQRKLMYFLCFLWTQIAFHVLINPIMFTNPLFMASGQIQTQAYCCAQQHQNKCDYTNDFTATYQAGLYCSNRDIRMILQSIFALGCMIGVIVIPIINDLKGRKFSIFICLLSVVIGDLGIFIGTFYKMYFLLGISQFLSAAGSVSSIVITYSINSDYLPQGLRQRAINYYCSSWGLADMSIILVYYFLSYWMLYLIFILLIPSVLLLLYIQTFLFQSAHYAINSKRNFELANQTLQKLAEFNDATRNQLKQAKQIIKQLQRDLESVDNQKEQKHQSTSQTLKIILNTPKYFKALCCLILIKIAYYSFYFGIQGSVERISFNLGISMLLLGAGQFIAYSTGTKFIPHIPRRKILFVTNALLVVFTMVFITKTVIIYFNLLITQIYVYVCLIHIKLLQNVKEINNSYLKEQYLIKIQKYKILNKYQRTVKQSNFIASIFLLACFILSSYNFSGMALIETQSFPSSIRSTGIGLAFGFSSIIRIIMPFLIGFCNQHKFPTIIASSMLILIVGVIPPLVIDQTYVITNLQEPLITKQSELSQQLQILNQEQNNIKFIKHKKQPNPEDQRRQKLNDNIF